MATAGINLSVALDAFGDITAVSSPTQVWLQESGGFSPTQTSNQWTPQQYGEPALTILTVPATGNPVLVQSSGANAAPIFRGGTPSVDYVFDAVFRVGHSRRLRKTQHPVLAGANIADHAYVEAARVTLEVGMSDAQAAFMNGIWVGSATKSVSAWQILKSLQTNRTLVTLTTRLDTYFNMLVVEVSAPDDANTLHGLRATVTLEEIIAGSVSSVASTSARPHDTNSTPMGVVQAVPVDPALLAQHLVVDPTGRAAKVPGAGNISSNSIKSLPGQ